MAKQINQYTKTRTSGTIQDDDLFDLDSTEDSGSTFESAKLKISELVTYLSSAIPTFFSSDGAITETRNVEMNGFSAEFENGTVISKSNLNDVGFILQDSLAAEKGSLGYDVGLDSATLDLKDANGTFLNSSDGNTRLTSSSGTLLDADYLKDALGFGIPAQNGTKFLFFNSAARTNVFNFVNSTNSTNFAFTDAGNFGIGTATPSAKLNIKGSTVSASDTALLVQNTIADLFTIKNDGFVGIGTSTQVGSELLNVAAGVKITDGIGANGTNPSVGVALRTALNSTAISFGTTGGAALYQQSGNIRLSSPAANSALKFELGFIQALDLQQGSASTFNTELKLNHLGALVTDQIRNTDIQLISGYWDGAASQDKVSSILHNITASPSGDSQLDFSIGGTAIVSFKDSGVLNIANIPTSSVGLVAGDVWSNSGVLTIV